MAPFNSVPSLVVISDTGRARRIPIPFGGMVLGRDARLGPPFSTDEFVSRSHASVRCRGDGVEIADLGSANGTYVNGARVHAPAPMKDGDVLRIGGIQLKLATPARAAAPVGGAAPGAVSYRVDGPREGFLREIAATKAKARWLIGVGSVSLVAGVGIAAAGVLGFLKQVNGVPFRLIGCAPAAQGMLLIIAGIVLQIVAGSRRRRVGLDAASLPR